MTRMNDWHILNLKPTKNKREIKRAYAKLLAQYHPEENPELFAQIRGAYDSAMNYAGDQIDYSGQKQPVEYANIETKPESREIRKQSYEYTREIEIQQYEYNDDLFFFADDADEISEEDTANMQSADAALRELERIFDYAPGVLLKTSTLQKGLKKFVAGDLFMSVKENAFFYDGLIELLNKQNRNRNLRIENLKVILGAVDFASTGIGYYKHSGELIHVINNLEIQIIAKNREGRLKAIVSFIVFALIMWNIFYWGNRFFGG